MKVLLFPRSKLKAGMLLLVVMALALIVYGLIIPPAALDANSLIPVITILLLYFLVSRFDSLAPQTNGSNAFNPGILGIPGAFLGKGLRWLQDSYHTENHKGKGAHRIIP